MIRAYHDRPISRAASLWNAGGNAGAVSLFAKQRDTGKHFFVEHAHVRPRFFVARPDLCAQICARLLITGTDFCAQLRAGPLNFSADLRAQLGAGRRKLCAHFLSKLHELQFQGLHTVRQVFEAFHFRSSTCTRFVSVC
jgi:hypothetical protein